MYVVTGGSSGIGAGIVDELRRRGKNVLILSRTKPKLEKFVSWVFCDLTSVPSVEGAISAVLRQPKLIQGLILSAGYINREVPGFTRQGLAEMLINYVGQKALIQKLLPHFREDARVLLLGSFLENGSAKFPEYAASKAAMGAYVKSLGKMWAAPLVTEDGKTTAVPNSRRRAYVVYPGRVNTPGNPKREVLPGELPYFEVNEVAPRIIDVLHSDLPSGSTVDLGKELCTS